MYKVGDLFQSKKGFLQKWISDKTWVLVEIKQPKPNERYGDPFVMYCQENGRTLNVGKMTLDRDMVKLNDI